MNYRLIGINFYPISGNDERIEIDLSRLPIFNAPTEYDSVVEVEYNDGTKECFDTVMTIIEEDD